MKLTFFGSSLVSAYWNGAATYYRGLLRALAGRGHDITFCEPDAFDRQAHRDLKEDPRWSEVVVYATERDRDRLIAHALDVSDWVVKCSGVGVWDDEILRAVAAGSGGHARTAFWDVDAPATLAQLRTRAGDPLRTALPLLDHVFTYGGGPPVVGTYRHLGARACTPVYNGLDAEEHRPVHTGEEARWDMLFMGNRLPDREERVERFFFQVAAACRHNRFALGGEGWGDEPMPSNVEYLGHVPTARHNEINCAARLVLNVHRQSMVENGFSPATRMFEAAGAGACQITDDWEGIEAFFDPGREILVAPDGIDVARFVREVGLDRARRIGEAARKRALRDHTYTSRAAVMDRALRSNRPARIATERRTAGQRLGA